MNKNTFEYDFATTVLSNQGMTIVPFGKPRACECCRRKIPANQPVVVWLAKSQSICLACAILYLKRGSLLTRVENLTSFFGQGEGAFLKLMRSSALGRLVGVVHSSELLIDTPVQRWGKPVKVVLTKGLLDIFGELIKSIVHPTQDLQGTLIRLLGHKILCDLVKGQPSLSQSIEQLVREGDPDLILGLLEVLPSFGWPQNGKINLLSIIPNTDDRLVSEALVSSLKKYGVQSVDELKNLNKHKEHAERLLHSHSVETIRAMHGFIFRFIPGGSDSTKCSTLALEIVAAIYEEQDVERFYQALPDGTRKLIDLLLWRRAPLTSQEIESKYGLRTTRNQKSNDWHERIYVEAEPEYHGLLGVISLDANRTGVLIFDWLAGQFKKILPKPVKATLTGSDTPPSIPSADIVDYNPDFVALLPNIYHQLQQNTLPLKLNGTPTIAGYRTLATFGGEYKEFYPNHKTQRALRSELLYRMFEDIVIPAGSEVTSPLIAKALLDYLFKPLLSHDDDAPCVTSYTSANIVSVLLTHLEWRYRKTDLRFEKAYLDVLQYLMSSMPKGQWVTVDDALDYLFLNDKRLGSSVVMEMAQAVVQNDWGSKGYARINLATISHYWEEPLLKAFILLLASISAVEVLCGEPVSAGICAYNQTYLSRADGVIAFRITPLGEWYFRGGDESCFKKLEQGRIVLDQKRLLLQLHGNDIALKAALMQTTNRVGENFYSVDSGSFLKECRSEAAVIQKINVFKGLLPDELPQVWQDFFETTLARLNPLRPLKSGYTILQLNDAPELKQLLLSNRKLRQLAILAEGGMLLVLNKNMRAFKKLLADLGFFVNGF